MSKCTFCEIPETEKIFENAFAYALRDLHPVTHGHTLIIPKRHVESWFDLSGDEIDACNDLLRTVRLEILESDRTVSGFNIGVNIGRDAGQTIMHCHIHIIPRRSGDTRNPRGGVRGVIPGKRGY